MRKAPDKSEWPKGPWTDEPDRIEFRAHGFPCIVLRGPVGALCGYVGVPKGHPWHGRDYDELPVEVHGGLTYGEPCTGDVCHEPAPGEPDDVYWLGFDTAHCHDLAPLLLTLTGRTAPKYGEVYRTLAYVRAETESLAEQAKAATCP